MSGWVCVQSAFLRRLSSVLVTSTYCRFTRTIMKYLRLKCNYRVPPLWSSVLPRLSDWTFDALDSRVDGLRLSEYLSLCACVSRIGEGVGGGFRKDRKFRFLNSSSCMLLRCSKSASHFAVFTFPFLPSACLMHLLDVGKGALYRRAGSYNIRISDSTLRNSRCGV